MNFDLKVKLAIVALAVTITALAALHGFHVTQIHVLGEPEVAGGAGAGAQ